MITFLQVYLLVGLFLAIATILFNLNQKMPVGEWIFTAVGTAILYPFVFIYIARNYGGDR